MNLLNKLKAAYSKVESSRTGNSLKNIVLLFGLKILSVPISFLIVSSTINYIDQESYGVWLALSSIISWMSFFDIGLNNGLRNKLTESLANNDLILSRKYVSTTYSLLSLISIVLLTLFLCINLFLDWSSILKVSADLSEDLFKLAIIISLYFCIRFVFSTIGVIFYAFQKSAMASLQTFLEQLSSLITILILIYCTNGSLIYLGLAMCVSPIIFLVIFNIIIFSRKEYRVVRPSFKYVDFTKSKDIMGVGIKFFIIQIAAVIQYQTSNFIIIRNFGASDVTMYNIVFKYFSVITMVMVIFTTPLWSAVTEAHFQKDIKWIKNEESKYLKIFALLLLVGLTMLFLSNNIYHIWLGENIIDIPFSFSFAMFIFVIFSAFGSIYCAFLNGLSILNLQVLSSLFSPIIFLALNYVFVNKLGLGVSSVIYAALLSNFYGAIIAPIQFKRFLKANIL